MYVYMCDVNLQLKYYAVVLKLNSFSLITY